MTIFDLIVLLLLLWGAYKGYEKGFVVQSFTLIALVLGVWAGIVFSHVASVYLTCWFSIHDTLAFVISFTIIFLMVLVGVNYLGKLLTNLFSKSALGKLNQIGGVCFGIVKMAFMISIIIFILQRIDLNNKLFPPKKIKNSKLYTLVAKIAPAVFPHLHLDELKYRFLKI